MTTITKLLANTVQLCSVCANRIACSHLWSVKDLLDVQYVGQSPGVLDKAAKRHRITANKRYRGVWKPLLAATNADRHSLLQAVKERLRNVED